MYIHRLALVAPSAKLGQDVQIGPFCVVEEDAQIGDGTILEARVTIKKGVIVGKNNHISRARRSEACRDASGSRRKTAAPP